MNADPRHNKPAASAPDDTVLRQVTGPDELRRLPPDQLERLAAEVRAFLVEKVAATGGHLGPNLGMVELTIALHRVFISPRDTIVFDTGHQAYVHKMLTGRLADFELLRGRGGLSGYPSQAESVHDVVENSHASTALAYADGLSKVNQQRGRIDRSVVAVIGDGALTGGLAWEGLNNLGGAPDRPVIVVLNDNGRSYAPTVGGLGHHLRALRTPPGSWLECYTRDGHTVGDNLFTHLGFAYIGPIDGHDIAACERALRVASDMRRPVVVHAITKKGHGYAPAEADQADHMHGIGVIDPVSGKSVKSSSVSWTKVFADELCAIGAERDDIVAITAAMPGPTGLAAFAARFPGRTYDVGIAEQHATGSAAGLALGGLHPVVAVYSTFLNRALDQVIMDVALHRLPVTFVLDRAGITGPDGPSHHGMWDLSILSVVPGLRVAAPRDSTRLRELLREAVEVTNGPTVLRFPKATAGTDIDAVVRMDGIDILHRSRHRPLDVLLVAAGALAGACLQAAAVLEDYGVGVTVADPRWVIPVNPSLTGLAARHDLVVTAEDSSRTGGMGASLAQACADAAVTTSVRNLGLPRAFIEHGDRPELLAHHGLSGEQIAQTVLRYRSELSTRTASRAEGSRR
jgi:1-deoxy-D-xylulose-5-phosphate synthase